MAPWTPEEDSVLETQVSIYGDKHSWGTISLAIPGRSNKACRKRYLHSLSPDVRKEKWTPEEDALLLSLHQTYPGRWSVIARHIIGRTDDACSKRYREALDPAIKKDEWTEDEDQMLLDEYTARGGKWSQVCKALGRSSLGCRNRWRLLQRKTLREASTRLANTVADDTSTSLQPVSNQSHQPFVRDPSLPTIDWPGPFISVSAPASTANCFAQSGTDHHHHDFLLDPALRLAALPTVCQSRSMTPPAFYQGSSSLASALDDPRAFASRSDTTLNGPAVGIDERSPRSDFHHEGEDELTTADEVSSSADQTLWDFPPDIVAASAEAPIASDLQNPDEPPQKRRRVNNELPATGASSDAQATRRARGKRRASVDNAPARLSGFRAVTADRAVLPYGCGVEECWVQAQAELQRHLPSAGSQVRFATSAELADHRKQVHPELGDAEKAYRCALKGCGKGWKNINGIQYHLQVSQAHFQNAVNRVCIQGSSHVDETTIEVSPRPSKLHVCPHDGCSKAYKQSSGLRYHLSHGHPDDPPIQLELVPPGLQRKVAKKLGLPHSAL